MSRKNAKKIDQISSCFSQVKDSVNQLIDNQKPWNNVQGVGSIVVQVSDANVQIGLKGEKIINANSDSSSDTFPFKTTGRISGSQAVLNVEPGMINTKYVPKIYGTSISLASRPDIIVTGPSGSVWVGVTFDSNKTPMSIYLDGGGSFPTSSTSLEILPISEWFKSGSGADARFGTMNQYVYTGMTYYWCGDNVIWNRS